MSDSDSSAQHAQVSVGLVLGAGGIRAQAWHGGVLAALQDATGWDARDADLIAGTSAGSISGLCLRAGVSPADMFAMQRGDALSEAGEAILARVVTPYVEGHNARAWTENCPQSPWMSARALWPPWQARPVHAAVGLMPRGTATTETFGQRLSELHPSSWTDKSFWVPAVRLSDGSRVVFGRDDIEATVAEAVRASCAVPGRFAPVTVGEHRYVDGGVHSATNADLLGPPAFDVVVVSSVMSGEPGWSAVNAGLKRAWSSVAGGLGLGAPRRSGPARDWLTEAMSEAWSQGRAVRAGRRQWMDERLREELENLRRRGIKVLVVEPDAAAVALLDGTSRGEPSSSGDNADDDAGSSARDHQSDAGDDARADDSNNEVETPDRSRIAQMAYRTTMTAITSEAEETPRRLSVADLLNRAAA